MTPSEIDSDRFSSVVREEHLETGFLGKLQGLKYEYRRDIRDRATLDESFRQKFEALYRVHLTDSEFSRLMEEFITPDVFTAAKTLRAMNAFILPHQPRAQWHQALRQYPRLPPASGRRGCRHRPLLR